MRLRDFARGKVLFLAVVIFDACLTATLLYAFRAEVYFALLPTGVLLLGSLLALLPEYLAKRRFYAELEETLRSLDKRYLLPEIIEPPGFAEGDILCDTLRAAGEAMSGEVAEYRRSAAEYREYIELWVHEIKTPIAAVKLSAENAKNSDIITESEKIERMVEQALFYARGSDTEQDYVIKRTELSALVGGALKSNARYLIARRISVDTERLTHSVLTDAKWIAFILGQLIDNSVKYGCTQLEFESAQGDGSVSLFMRDNGVGIPSGDIGRVFSKGFTGENGRVFGRSTGLGLYLCRKLCLKLGLEITARRRPVTAEDEGQSGTEIEIIFPMREL
ncbi:MAG: sensor histidine kinase [Oscillospiraceae bacterium]|nr:sensor histidine kinase [Oscillospiraceae bacterium]